MKEFAKKFLINQNPNEETFKEISEAIRANHNYCCCAIKKEPDTMCVCKAFRDKQESGFCHCGRFYKVQDFPVVTIICTPEDNDRAQAMAEDLTQQGFIVIIPMYRDTINYLLMTDFYNEMQKAKIYKADIVLVLNTSEEAMEFLAEQINWAEELQKKIIYEHTEEVEEDEV